MTVTNDPLRTPLCDRLGIDVPILLAGMGGIAMADLCSAVSNSGGLGFLGGMTLTVAQLKDEIAATKARTDRPFGVDVFLGTPPSAEVLDRLAASLPPGAPPLEHGAYDTFLRTREMAEAVIEGGVPFLASALANPGWFTAEAHAAGVTVLSLVGSVRQAVECVAAGADMVVAQGYDAGGHTGRIGTMSLIPQIADAVDVPVIAAGGIGDGRGVAAALALGAEAVWVGTRFVATREAQVVDSYKSRLVGMGDDDTVITKGFSGKPCRLAKNEFTAFWERDPERIQPFPAQGFASREVRRDKADDDADWLPMPAGQISGLVHDIPSAADVLERLADEARAILNRLGTGARL